MSDTIRDTPDPWTLVAALIGFFSGAGLMSHADLVTWYRAEFFGFIQITGPDVVIQGRQMIAMVAGTGSYLLVLALIAGVSISILTSKSSAIRLAGLGVLLFVISFMATASYAVDTGYQEIQQKLETARKLHSDSTIIPEWHWK